MASLLCIGVGISASLSVALLIETPVRLVIAVSNEQKYLMMAVQRLSSLGAHLPPGLSSTRSAKAVSQELAVALRERGAVLSQEAAYVLALILVGVSALLGSFIALSWLGLLVGVLVSCFALVFWSSSHARQRLRAISQQVPDIYRSLSSALTSGRTLAQAISFVGSSGAGLLYQEFARCALMVSCGVSALDALSELPERVQAPGIDLMVSALTISARTGAPLQSLFARSANLVEKRFELERELSAKTAQVRLSARLVTALPAGLVCLLILISPDFKQGLNTSLGAGCLATAIVLDICALLIIRQLMKGVI